MNDENTWYKVLDKNNKAKDGGDFDYTPYLKGKQLPVIENISLCNNGYHITKYWNMYLSDETDKIYIVKPEGILSDNEVVGVNDKAVCKTFKILKEFKPVFDKKLNTGYGNTGDRNTGDWNTGYRNTGYRNTGDWNTGCRNTGYRNTGDWNTGDWNTGDWNTGDWNTGDWNTGDGNTGYLNTDVAPVRIFNKLTKVKRGDLVFPSFFRFENILTVKKEEMTNAEKEKYPEYSAESFIRVLNYKRAFTESFKEADKEDIKKLLRLPNFNYKIFEEISGITKKMIDEKIKEEEVKK